MSLMRMLTGSIAALVGGVLGGYGAQKAIVQWPAFAIRRVLMLTLVAVGSLVILLMGLSFLLSGLAELSSFYEAPWVFSIAVGAVIGLVGAFGLGMAFRKDSWAKTIPQPAPRVAQSQNPLVDTFVLLASDFLEERRIRREGRRSRLGLGDREVDTASYRREDTRALHEETLH